MRRLTLLIALAACVASAQTASGHVLPNLFLRDQVDRVLADAITPTNIDLAPSSPQKISDFRYFLLRQFGVVNFGSSWTPEPFLFRQWAMCHATLFGGISGVVSPCPKPEMGRVYAGWIVSIWAVVTNKHPFRDWPLEDDIGDPRGSIPPPSWEIHNSVPVGVDCTWPNPTLVFVSVWRYAEEKLFYV